MHIIGFSHHYTKMHGQTSGTLVSVRSTKQVGNRPDAYGIRYDTEFCYDEEWQGVLLRHFQEFSFDKRCVRHYPLKKKDFKKPLLQLVFVGTEHQIPFTTYREYPKNYVPANKGSNTYSKAIPYSDLIGEKFAFKFKCEKIPASLEKQINSNAVRIFH